MVAENPKPDSSHEARRFKMWVAVFATFTAIAAVWLVTLPATLPGSDALGEEKKIIDEAQKSLRGGGDELRNRAENLGEALQEETNRATSSASSGATTTNP